MNEEFEYGKLGTVTDDEYFEAVSKLPRVLNANGEEVDVTSDIIDARGEKNA